MKSELFSNRKISAGQVHRSEFPGDIQVASWRWHGKNFPSLSHTHTHTHTSPLVNSSWVLVAQILLAIQWLRKSAESALEMTVQVHYLHHSRHPLPPQNPNPPAITDNNYIICPDHCLRAGIAHLLWRPNLAIMNHLELELGAIHGDHYCTCMQGSAVCTIKLNLSLLVHSLKRSSCLDHESPALGGCSWWQQRNQASTKSAQNCLSIGVYSWGRKQPSLFR